MPTFDVTVTVFTTSTQTLAVEATDRRQAHNVARERAAAEGYEWDSSLHEVRIDDIEQVED